MFHAANPPMQNNERSTSCAWTVLAACPASLCSTRPALQLKKKDIRHAPTFAALDAIGASILAKSILCSTQRMMQEIETAPTSCAGPIIGACPNCVFHAEPSTKNNMTLQRCCDRICWRVSTNLVFTRHALHAKDNGTSTSMRLVACWRACLPTCVPRSGPSNKKIYMTLNIAATGDGDSASSRHVHAAWYQRKMRRLNIHVPGPVALARVNQLVFRAGLSQKKNIRRSNIAATGRRRVHSHPLFRGMPSTQKRIMRRSINAPGPVIDAANLCSRRGPQLKQYMDAPTLLRPGPDPARCQLILCSRSKPSMQKK
jgi:hypothetical protein